LREISSRTVPMRVVFDIICRRYFGDICRMPSLCNDNRSGERKPMTATGVLAFS
jgi:hypothetical protein